MPSDPSAKRPRRVVRLGKYEVVAHIASGGMGAVYKAIDTVLKREVALKVLPPRVAADPVALERFRREARNVAKLRHENIVTIYEFDEANGTCYLAMEFIDGIDLLEYIRRKGRLDPEEARLVAIQAARALDHAHGQGVVHRDLKPSNFLVSKKGEQLVVKMSDFGLARGDADEEARVTRDGTTVGTVDYIAPEQARDSGTADIRSDIYSLGCTLFHMLAGKAPFAEGSIAERLYKHKHDEPPDLRLLNPRVSEAFCAVVRRTLAKDPRERYPTPAALLKDLIRLESATDPLTGRDVLEGLALAAEEEASSKTQRRSKRAEPPPRPAAPPVSRRRRGEPERAPPPKPTAGKPSALRGPAVWLLGGAAVVLVLAVVGVVVGLRPAPPPRESGTEVSPPLVVAPHVGGTGRDPGSPVPPPILPKDPAAPVKPEWPALYAPSAPLAKDKLTEEFLGPWARPDEPGPDVPVLRVARLPAGEGAFPSLEAACAAAPTGRLTIIEVHDNGPIFQPSVTVADRSLVIRAGKGYRPLLVWDVERTKDEARRPKEEPASFLALARGRLTLERLDVVGKWTEPAAAGRPFLVRVTGGDFLARDCTFSLTAGQAAEVGAVRFERGGEGSVRCRLSRCVVRGPGLVALDLDAPGADVLLDGCLVVGSDQPLLQVAGHNRTPTVLRVLRSTLVAGQSLLQVRPATPGDTLPVLHVRGWDALLARGGGQPGGQMVVLAGAVSQGGMKWEAVNCLYAGWRTLLAAGGRGINELTPWQVGWGRAEGDVAIAPTWPAVLRHDPAEVSVEDYRPAASPASPVGYAATSAAGPLGCDPAALPPARTNWLALTYDSYPIAGPETINAAVAPPVPVVNDGRYHGGRIDLAKTPDLGAFLEEMRRTKGLGPRVVLHLVGSGEHKTRSLRVKGSSLVLYCEPAEGRSEPPILMPHDTVPPEGDALVEVDGGSLEMIGGAVRFPDYRLALMPPHVLKVRGGDLRLFRCRLYGPLLAAPPSYRGLIRFEGASGETDPTKPRGCALNETVLVSGKTGVHVVGGGARLRLRQCVLLSSDEALYFEPGAKAKARLDVQCFLEETTVAARRTAIHLGDAPHLEGPVEPIVMEARFSAFLNPFTDAPAAPALLLADDGALARGLLVWQGGGNAFDKRLGRDVAPKSPGAPPFARLWGRAWERRQALDVPLTRTLDLAKPDLGRLALPPALVKPLPGEEKRPAPGADFELLGLFDEAGEAAPLRREGRDGGVMRFALLGTHPDGIDMACALVETGRHELIAYTSAEPVADHVLRRWGPNARRLHDLEDLLADPAVEAVIVAGTPANRTVQLRRSLQSERHVLCVHPPDAVPDGAYEAAMIRQDTGRVLLPLLPEALHPGVVRLAEVVRAGTRPLVEVRLIEVERWGTDQVLLDTGGARHRPAFPGWDVLRVLGGEVAEVSALAKGEELTTEEPVLLSGRFERGALFQAALLPFQSEPRWRVVAVGSHGRAELLFPVGGRGPAFLSWRAPDGETHEETWDAWDPWPALVELFEAAVADVGRGAPRAAPGAPLTWQDAVRCLELDDAARRSVQRRRASPMEYQEASEEVGFKGTMTLVGCGLIWLTILIVVLAIWAPKAGWAVVPLLVVFLGLQAFRWVIPRQRRGGERGQHSPPGRG